MNVTLGPTEERILNTGLHKVRLLFFILLPFLSVDEQDDGRFLTYIAIAAMAIWVGGTRKRLSKAKSIRKTKLFLKKQG